MLEELKDQVVPFFGVDCNQFKLGRTVYEAIEDESDGYRSYLDSIVVVKSDGIFSSRRIADVRVVIDPQDVGTLTVAVALVDADDGHVWLRIGTDYSDDYYPMFRFEYNPKERG